MPKDWKAYLVHRGIESKNVTWENVRNFIKTKEAPVFAFATGLLTVCVALVFAFPLGGSITFAFGMIGAVMAGLFVSGVLVAHRAREDWHEMDPQHRRGALALIAVANIAVFSVLAYIVFNLHIVAFVGAVALTAILGVVVPGMFWSTSDKVSYAPVDGNDGGDGHDFGHGPGVLKSAALQPDAAAAAVRMAAARGGEPGRPLSAATGTAAERSVESLASEGSSCN